VLGDSHTVTGVYGGLTTSWVRYTEGDGVAPNAVAALRRDQYAGSGDAGHGADLAV